MRHVMTHMDKPLAFPRPCASSVEAEIHALHLCPPDRVCRRFTRKHCRSTIVGFGDWGNVDRKGVIKGSSSHPTRYSYHCCTVVAFAKFRASVLHQRCNVPLAIRWTANAPIEVHVALHGEQCARHWRWWESSSVARNFLMLLCRHLANLPRLFCNFRRGAKANAFSPFDSWRIRDLSGLVFLQIRAFSPCTKNG